MLIHGNRETERQRLASYASWPTLTARHQFGASQLVGLGDAFLGQSVVENDLCVGVGFVVVKFSARLQSIAHETAVQLELTKCNRRKMTTRRANGSPGCDLVDTSSNSGYVCQLALASTLARARNRSMCMYVCVYIYTHTFIYI